MNGFTFIIGGGRSGKSAFALKLSESFPVKDRVYVATAKALDPEMTERIRLHKGARGPEWKTVEEPLDIAAQIGATGPECVVIVDCLTLWLSNLMEQGLSDAAILDRASALASIFKGSPSAVIAVSNEVGLSIVPANALARRFRDLSGAINQITALAADEVFFIAAGIPMKIK